MDGWIDGRTVVDTEKGEKRVSVRWECAALVRFWSAITCAAYLMNIHSRCRWLCRYSMLPASESVRLRRVFEELRRCHAAAAIKVSWISERMIPPISREMRYKITYLLGASVCAVCADIIWSYPKSLLFF